MRPQFSPRQLSNDGGYGGVGFSADARKPQIRRYIPSWRDIWNGFAESNIIFNPFVLLSLVVPILAFIFYSIYMRADQLEVLYRAHVESNLLAILLFSGLTVFLVTVFTLRQPTPVYLIDFATYKPPEHLKCDPARFLDMMHRCSFSEESQNFQAKVLQTVGLGTETYLPSSIINFMDEVAKMPYKVAGQELEELRKKHMTFKAAREEVEAQMYSSLDELFLKTRIKPKEVDMLIVTCSIFNPTPSLAAMIVHHYKMKPTVQTFNLGGMGCAGGLLGIDLARQLLQVHRNATAVVVSAESLTQQWYTGDDKSMMITNVLFRMGASAVLLSNKGSHRSISKYQLVTSVRNHKGANDSAYRCVYQDEDAQGKLGLSLSKDILLVAGGAVKSNITTLGPLVLPVSEQGKFLINFVQRKVFKKKVPPYVPNFKRAFEHCCIHAAGRGIIDEVGQNLRLSERHLEPSRYTLHRYGNTSSSSVFYELEYIEDNHNIIRGERVWQIAFGSGFKCASVVWQALRSIDAHMSEEGVKRAASSTESLWGLSPSRQKKTVL